MEKMWIVTVFFSVFFVVIVFFFFFSIIIGRNWNGLHKIQFFYFSYFAWAPQKLKPIILATLIINTGVLFVQWITGTRRQNNMNRCSIQQTDTQNRARVLNKQGKYMRMVNIIIRVSDSRNILTPSYNILRL